MQNNSRFFFALLSAGAAIGIGSLWLFPYYSFKVTGLFFIPYLIALVLLGVPLLMLEFAAGQYFDRNVVDSFASVKKLFSGIGWLMIANAFVVASVYAIIVSWHLVYILTSFGLQWSQNPKHYFFSNVLQAPDGFAGFAELSLPVFIGLAIAWVGIFFLTRKGFETIKKSFLFLIAALSVLTVFFLAYSLSLDGALSGVYSFLEPRFGSLLEPDVWIFSFSLAALSLGLASGVMPTLARKSQKERILSNSLIVVAAEMLAGIAIGFILFSMLGFLSMKTAVPFSILVSSDASMPFTTLARALPLSGMPFLMSVLMFLFLMIFALLGACALAYSVSHVLVHKFKAKHMQASILVAGFGFLFSLLFAIKPGYYIMDIVSHFVAYNILITILLEAVAIGWFFDSGKLPDHINLHSGLKIGGLWLFAVRYFVPLVIGLLIFLMIKSDLLLDYNNYPLWAVLSFGIGTVAVPILVAFLLPQRLLDRK